MAESSFAQDLAETTESGKALGLLEAATIALEFALAATTPEARAMAEAIAERLQADAKARFPSIPGRR